MSPYRPQTALVLGGIRSGKSEFAESLVSDAPVVRYIATADYTTVDYTTTTHTTTSHDTTSHDTTGHKRTGHNIATGHNTTGDASTASDGEWSARIEAHRRRRPAHWITEEISRTPDDLASLIAAASSDETILVDDIGGWVTTILDRPTDETAAAISALAEAVSTTPARVVIVSPEVGLSVIPATYLGRIFADVTGSANRALADVCNGVVLTIAGQPAWLKRDSPPRDSPPRRSATQPTIITPASPDRTPAFAVVRTTEGVETTGGTAGVAAEATRTYRAGENPVHAGMLLPLPDDVAAIAATERIVALPVPGAGLGRLAPVVAYAAGVQGTERPKPFASVRVVALHGRYAGDIAAGEDATAWWERLDAPPADTTSANTTSASTSLLASMAAEVGATIEIVDADTAAPIEDGDAGGADDIDAALEQGWRIANAAADRGDDLIVLAAGGPGVDAAASATVAAISRTEITSLLGRVWAPGGIIDDQAWMTRCVTIRDRLLRIRSRMSDGPHTLIAFGGPTIAIATGLLLGAAERRTPVMIDGPVGAAAAMTARDYAAQVQLWCLLADHGNHPTVRAVAEMLDLTPVFDLRMGLGEGVNALAVLPLIQSALKVSMMDGADTGNPNTGNPNTGDPNTGDPNTADSREP